MRTPAASFTALLVLAGCDGSTSAGPTASTINDFQAGYFLGLCQLQARCGVIGASELQRCSDSFGLLRGGPIDFGKLVEIGHVAFDSAAAGRCLGLIPDFSCTNLGGGDEAGDCRGAIQGLVPVGGACVADLECAAGACSSDPDGCTGTCVALAATGSSCVSTRCGDSDSCDLMTHTCKARGTAGVSCVYDGECVPGLRCVPSPMGPTTCVAPGIAGASCPPNAGNHGCAAGLYCDGATSTCRAQLARGAVCASPSECDSGLACIGWQAGSPGSKGTCGPFLDAGVQCTPGQSGCPLDMTCDGTTRVCLAPPAPGADCPASQECGSGAYCDGVTRKCAARVAYGAACKAPQAGGPNPCGVGACEPASGRCLVLCR